jgi:hypothetical protein
MENSKINKKKKTEYMKIKIVTAYEIGQEINENGLKGTVVRIEIIVFENERFVDYILDNGGKLRIKFKPDK